MTSRLTWAGPNAQASCLKTEMGRSNVLEMSPLLNLSDLILNYQDPTPLVQDASHGKQEVWNV